MIAKFQHKGLDDFYRTKSFYGIQPAHAPKVARILAALDAAATVEELNLPAFGLKPLTGQVRGYWSIWVSGNWRVTFRFTGPDLDLVDYVDYH